MTIGYDAIIYWSLFQHHHGWSILALGYLLNPATSLHLSLLIQITTCLNRTTENSPCRASWLHDLPLLHPVLHRPASSSAPVSHCSSGHVTGKLLDIVLGHGQGTPTPLLMESLWELSEFSFDANICIYMGSQVFKTWQKLLELISGTGPTLAEYEVKN